MLVRAGRIPPEALVRAEAVTGERFVPAHTLELYRSLRSEAALAYAVRFDDAPAPIVTALLVGIQVRVWWLAKLPGAATALVALGTKWTPPVFEDGQVWRLLTMGLIHTDFLHILMNMMWLAYVGYSLERALGRVNLLLIYFASVLGGSALSVFLSAYASSLGASGGVFGLIAAATVFGFARPELLPARARRWFGWAMLPYLLLMFWSGWSNPSVDNWAHLGGLLTGLVLGGLVDPDGLERRRRWNRRLRAGIAAIAFVGLVALWALGPRIQPLYDSERARTEASTRPSPPTPGNRPPPTVVFAVPAGWRPAVDAGGGPAFVSPIDGGRARAFGVRVGEHPHPEPLEALAERWLDRVRDDWPGATAEPPAPSTALGCEGLAVDVTFGPSDDARVATWTGCARGVWTLEVVWQVDQARRSRLEPLHQRLLERIVWPEAPELVAARAEYRALPGSPRTKAAYASALGRSGDSAGALALHEEILATSGGDPKPWVDYLATVMAVGAPSPEVIVDRALAATEDPKVAVAAAEVLVSVERVETARGLLAIAWAAAPGDKDLKRALRGHGMSVELDGTGADGPMPWDIVHDPVTGGPRPAEEVRARLELPKSVAGADRAAEALARDRARVVAAAVAAVAAGDVRTALVPLLVLKDGYVAGADTDARAALADDLGRAAEGKPVDWVPDALGDAVERHPAFVEALRSS